MSDKYFYIVITIPFYDQYLQVCLGQNTLSATATYDLKLCPRTCSLDHNLLIKDEDGSVKAGVGIRLQHEVKYGIYVAGLTPNGPGTFAQMPSPCSKGNSAML